MAKRKVSPHIYAQKKLADYASKERFPDGKLPPERELCKEIGVSRGTLRKALKQLIMEGYVVSVPQKGNFITGAPKRINIGIIINDGVFANASVSAPLMMSGIMDVLGKSNCLARFINLYNLSKIEDIIQGYGLDGLLWCYPPQETFPAIKKIISNVNIPLMISTMVYDKHIREIPFKNHVSKDYVCIGEERAKYFLRKGHKKIAYIGDPENWPTFEAFRSTLKKSGIDFNYDWHIELIENIQERLPDIINRHKITGIVSNGGPDRLENVFIALEKNPEWQNIDLLVDYVPALPDLMKRHPGVKVSTINNLAHHKVGKTAAETLLKMVNGSDTNLPVLIKNEFEYLENNYQ